MNDGRHLFALYVPELPVTVHGNYTLTDRDLVHRIQSVLRLSVNDQLTLFTREIAAQVMIARIERTTVTVTINSLHKTTRYKPEIIFLLPLLKKDALSTAVYGLVEAGASAIMLVQCSKSQRAWGGAHEYERLSRVSIAAAEQAKNFNFPLLREPIALSDALKQLPAHCQRLYGDPAGKPLLSLLRNPQELALMIGPEGDLTQQEKQLLHAAAFEPAALTPTILRAESAAFCMTAIARTAIY